MFSSNAFGVVLKDNSKEEIMSALQCASRKERFICNHVSNLLLSGSGNVNTASAVHTFVPQEDRLLTPTEKIILKEIASGKTTKEIAAEKHLSFIPSTVTEKYIPQTGSEQCARGYQICHAGRHCGSGGILYLKQKSVPKINPNTPIHTDLEQRPIIKPASLTNRVSSEGAFVIFLSYFSTPETNPGFGVINHAKLSRCNSLLIFRKK